MSGDNLCWGEMLSIGFVKLMLYYCRSFYLNTYYVKKSDFLFEKKLQICEKCIKFVDYLKEIVQLLKIAYQR